MAGFSEWFAARPYRATLANILMLSLILAMAGSASLYKLLGGGALLLATLYFLRKAASRTFPSGRGRNAYQLALTWIPGLLAAALSFIGLYLIVASDAGGLAHLLGMLLFTIEIAMLALAGADLAPSGVAEAG